MWEKKENLLHHRIILLRMMFRLWVKVVFAFGLYRPNGSVETNRCYKDRNWGKFIILPKISIRSPNRGPSHSCRMNVSLTGIYHHLHHRIILLRMTFRLWVKVVLTFGLYGLNGSVKTNTCYTDRNWCKCIILPKICTPSANSGPFLCYCINSSLLDINHFISLTILGHVGSR